MEYVQKAIELARKEREKKSEDASKTESSASDETISATEAADAVGESELEASPEGSEKPTLAPAGAINYTQTRRVELNPATLMANRVVAAFDDDERAEPYRQLRTQILKEFNKNDLRTLAVTGPHEGAGKTLTALNTAISIAKEVNQTVLLVDLDFKGPSVADVLGIEIDVGLVEYLKGEATLAETMVNPGLDRLVLLPAMHMTGPTSEILSSPQMKATLKELRERYDERLIVFDLPPMLRDDDALVFTPFADATLLVVERGVTTREEVERSLHLLKDANVIGTVFNKAA